MKLFIFTGSNNHDTTKGVLKLQFCLAEKYQILKPAVAVARPVITIYAPGSNTDEAARQLKNQDGAIFFDPLGVSKELAHKCNELAAANPNLLIWYIDNGSSNAYRSIIREDNAVVIAMEVENAQSLAHQVVRKFLAQRAQVVAN